MTNDKMTISRQCCEKR